MTEKKEFDFAKERLPVSYFYDDDSGMTGFDAPRFTLIDPALLTPEEREDFRGVKLTTIVSFDTRLADGQEVSVSYRVIGYDGEQLELERISGERFYRLAY